MIFVNKKMLCCALSFVCCFAAATCDMIDMS